MTENEIATHVINTCFKIHTNLGPGLLELVYHKILVYELKRDGFKIQSQKKIPLIWENIEIEHTFYADIIVNDKVLIELKSSEGIPHVYFKQVITYLKLTNLKLGLLINFNETLLKTGIHRLVNKL